MDGGSTDAADARARGWRGAAAAWAGPSSAALAFALLAHWSWDKWADVLVDFGSELYTAWQLSEGRALYRDIAHRNGPLSPHLNALWFRGFGVSIKTLVYWNLAVLAAICALSWALFARCCGRLAATLACWTLLGVFGFSQYVGIANYNYVTPYQHAQTHGLALALLELAALGAWLRTGRLGWVALGGLCLGLVFLTKAELFVPAAAAAAGALVLAWSAPGGVGRARTALTLIAAALLPPAVCYAGLRAQMPADLALTGVLGNWRYLGGGVLADPFYRRGAGLDDAAGNALLALRMFAGIGLFAALALAMDRVLGARRGAAVWAALLGVATWAALLWPGLVRWPLLARALPLTSLLGAGWLFAVCLRHPADAALRARWGPLALWALFSLALLGKMALKARVQHYGFVLAMPASLLLVAALVGLLPRLAARRGGGAVARGLALGAVLAGITHFLVWSDGLYAQKRIAVGRGADRVLASPVRGRVFRQALERLERAMAPEATLLVLPEGASLNYWLRRANPTPFDLFLPAEFDAFGGESVMLDAIRASPPDFVVLAHRRHQEFGVGPFGRDPRNGQQIVEWIDRHYTRVGRIGAEPFRGRGVGLVILRRGEPPRAAPAAGPSEALR